MSVGPARGVLAVNRAPAVPAPGAPRVRVRYFSKGTAADPGSRYRIHQFVPGLRTLGIDVEVSPLFGDGYLDVAADPAPWRRALRRAGTAAVAYARRASRLARGGAADLVVIERQLFPYMPACVEEPLLRGRTPVALEFDDAVYLTPCHGGKLRRLVAAARVVIAGNAELARFAEPVARAVAVVPTVVDTERLPVRAGSGTRDRLVIGWIGLPYNISALERLAGPLARLAREVPIEMRVISSAAPRLPGVPVRLVPWEAEREGALVADLDVGVMPLPDDAWSRGKCGLKLLQYMAAGVPAVASPVGVNREIVTDGENGRLATTEAEWLAALRDLAGSPAERARLGRAGRRTVEARYSLAVWLPRLAALYREAASR